MTFAELEAARAALGLGVNAFCRSVGIAKSTYYQRKRQREQPGFVQRGIEAEVQSQCEKHPTLGYRPIHALVQDALKQMVSQSSVYRVMKRLGLLQPRVKGKNRGGGVPADLNPKEVGLTVGLDFTHWRKEPVVNVLEYQSRYCLASVAFREETAFTAVAAMKTALAEAGRLGLPVGGITVKSDHGSTFTADVFRAFLRENTLSQALSAVGKPQGMGRVERFNRSVKEQGLARFELEPGESAQVALDEFRAYYNACRPHQALGYRTPLEVIESLNLKAVQSG
jgi:putative transposase